MEEEYIGIVSVIYRRIMVQAERGTSFKLTKVVDVDGKFSPTL